MKNLHPVSETPPPERTRAFWQNVRWFIETIWSLFGGPQTIAALHTLTRTDHKLLAAWLRKAEILVRKLLLIEAADLPITETKYKARAALKREKTLRVFHADEPQLWRVSFRVAEGTRTFSHAKMIRVPKMRAEQRFAGARPLAERFEALLRVFDAPELYVKRCALLLRRRPRSIHVLAAPVTFSNFEEIFEPLRPFLLAAFGHFAASDTS